MLAPRSLFDDAQFLSQESKKQRPTVDLSVSSASRYSVARWGGAAAVMVARGSGGTRAQNQKYSGAHQKVGEVKKILKGSPDSIPSPSMKIKIMGGKVC